MRDQTAVEIGNEFKLYNIEMSVHAPITSILPIPTRKNSKFLNVCD